MIDPLSTWSRLMAAGFEMAQTSMRMSETVTASSDVIARRTGMLGSAMQTPAANLELARLVPEKIDAFSQSGSAIFQACVAMQSAWIKEAEHVSALAMRGRAPSLAELAAAQSRATAYTLSLVEAGSRMGRNALAPVHGKATANARRLSRRSKGSKAN